MAPLYSITSAWYTPLKAESPVAYSSVWRIHKCHHQAMDRFPAVGIHNLPETRSSKPQIVSHSCLDISTLFFQKSQYPILSELQIFKNRYAGMSIKPNGSIHKLDTLAQTPPKKGLTSTRDIPNNDKVTTLHQIDSNILLKRKNAFWCCNRTVFCDVLFMISLVIRFKHCLDRV